MASFKIGAIALPDTLLWKCFAVNQKTIRVNPLGQDGGMPQTFSIAAKINFSTCKRRRSLPLNCLL
jgi:hypothetical protein